MAGLLRIAQQIRLIEAFAEAEVERRPPVINRRLDPMESLSDAEFKITFRFEKHNANRLTEILMDDLIRPVEDGDVNGDRGRPLTPIQKVCIALNSFAGGHFQRISGLCGGVSRAAAHKAICQVTDAIVARRKEFIFFPSVEEMRESQRELAERFGLPRFAFGVDGMFVKFDGAPREIPQGNQKQDYWVHKGGYGINAMLVGNDKHLIIDLDVDWHGAAHDANVWCHSHAKAVIESQYGGEFLIAGDGAYPISEVLIKPFSTDESVESRQKRQFNVRLCAIRTVCTENLFARLKQRFPVLRNMRRHYLNAKKTIIAVCCLHNISIRWDDVDPEPVQAPQQHPLPMEAVEGNAVASRRRGQLVRDQLMFGMDPNFRRRR